MCLGEESLTYLSDLRETFKEQKLSLCFSKYKTQVSKHEWSEEIWIQVIMFSITQDILVDTWKFTGSGEAWNNLYVDFQIKEMNPLSP